MTVQQIRDKIKTLEDALTATYADLRGARIREAPIKLGDTVVSTDKDRLWSCPGYTYTVAEIVPVNEDEIQVFGRTKRPDGSTGGVVDLGMSWKIVAPYLICKDL